MKKSRKSRFRGWTRILSGDGVMCIRAFAPVSVSALKPNLPEGLRARAQEDVLLENFESVDLKSFEPDITIVETDRAEEAGSGGSVAVAIRPVLVRHISRQGRVDG